MGNNNDIVNIVDSSKYDDIIINKINNDLILKILKLNGISYENLITIFDGNVYTVSVQNKLNSILRNIKYEYNILLYEMILYFENFTDIRKILKFLDDENKWIIKNEMSKKYRIELETTILSDILC